METLNEKQKVVYDILVGFYGETKILAKEEDVLSKIRNFPEIDFYQTPEELKPIFNDIVFQSNLFERCILPPFSVLDTKQGDWRSRKNQLDAYLGDSTIGRAGGLAYGDLKVRKNDTGTSQFDSLLTEIILKWFGFKGCSVYDSFAGGHVRGTMAKLLGYSYLGIELATEQVQANKKRIAEINATRGQNNELDPDWVNDDSLNVDKYLEDNSVDLFFSCPPYGDLEKYTDDPRDLSNMGYVDFIENYRDIITKGVKKLKDNRFAVFVVGDFRDDKGFYRGFVKDTIEAFENAGMGLYNEIILLNNIGTAPMRANNAFANRKMIKLHQNVLVFYKGDAGKIKEIYGDIDSSLPIKQPEQKGLF